MEPLVPPRRAKQRNVRSHALRDELPSKLIRDRNPPRLAEPLCTLPPLTPDFQLRPHPSYTVLFPLLANHQANGINSPPSPRCSSISRARSFWNEKKISCVCHQTIVDDGLTLELGGALIGTILIAIFVRERLLGDFNEFIINMGTMMKNENRFFFFFLLLREEGGKERVVNFWDRFFFWFNFFGRDYATDCNIEFFREDQFFDEEVSWACAILFVYFFVL